MKSIWSALKHRSPGGLLGVGTDARKQPVDMPDIFPHDTAVVWTRQYLKKHPSTKGDLDGMEVALHNTSAECAAFINETYDVEGIQKVACASLALQ